MADKARMLKMFDPIPIFYCVWAEVGMACLDDTHQTNRPLTLTRDP